MRQIFFVDFDGSDLNDLTIYVRIQLTTNLKYHNPPKPQKLNVEIDNIKGFSWRDRMTGLGGVVFIILKHSYEYQRLASTVVFIRLLVGISITIDSNYY